MPGEYPRRFGYAIEVAAKAALKICQAHFADKLIRGPLAYREHAKAQQAPMTRITKQSMPGVFARGGKAANGLKHGWIAGKLENQVGICHRMFAQN